MPAFEPHLARALLAPLLALALLAAGTAAQAALDPRLAEHIVRDAASEVFATINDNRQHFEEEPSRLYGIIERIVLPHFDFERMARRVLGKHWPGASKTQQEQFTEQFQDLLVRTYATGVREYSTLRLDFLPMRVSEDGERVTVRTRVQTNSGVQVPIHYEMYAAGDDWKVYDVSIDGVSLVINYRASFADQIRKGGIDGLIQRLIQHNDGTSG